MMDEHEHERARAPRLTHSIRTNGQKMTNKQKKNERNNKTQKPELFTSAGRTFKKNSQSRSRAQHTTQWVHCPHDVHLIISTQHGRCIRYEDSLTQTLFLLFNRFAIIPFSHSFCFGPVLFSGWPLSNVLRFRLLFCYLVLEKKIIIKKQKNCFEWNSSNLWAIGSVVVIFIKQNNRMIATVALNGLFVAFNMPNCTRIHQ